jgi:Holliday junction resolvase
MDRCLFGYMFVITETKHTSENKVYLQSGSVLKGL